MTILFDSSVSHKPSPAFGAGVDLSSPAPSAPSAADAAWWQGFTLAWNEDDLAVCPFTDEDDPRRAAWLSGYGAGWREYEARLDATIMLDIPPDLPTWEYDVLDR